MKEMLKKIGTVAVMLVIVAGLNALGDTKYSNTGGTNAVTFGPRTAPRTVKCVLAASDKEDGVVKFYARPSTVSKLAPSSSYDTPTNGQKIIYWANSSGGFVDNDSVVYVHADGTCDYTTLTKATATNCTLATGISKAGATGDYLYEVTQQGQALVGRDGTATGTNDTLNITGDIFQTPGDSPLYVVLDGNTVATLTVTTD